MPRITRTTEVGQNARSVRITEALLAIATVAALSALMLCGLLSGGATPASASHYQVAPAAGAKTRVLQMNMCMWGAKFYYKPGKANCFPDPYYSEDASGNPVFEHGYTAREKLVAGWKRQAVVNEILKLNPDVVTINEACQSDIDAVVATLQLKGASYESEPYEVGRGSADGPRHCSVDRGAAVNVVLARALESGSVSHGYFETGGYRSWVCVRAVWGDERVCTAHLSLAGQDWGGRSDHQAIECRELRTVLADDPGHPTIFAGDTNMKSGNCAPSGFWGLHDVDVKPADRTPQSGLQHIYYSDDFSRRSGCGEMHVVPHTDHKGFMLDLYPVSSPTRGKACTWRDVLQ